MFELTVLPGKAVDEEANNCFPENVINNNYNFYSQNARCIPEGLRYVEKSLLGEQIDKWIEYVPSCYKEESAVPLVITMHGGGQSAWHQFYTTSWIEVAEKNNVIIVSPNAPKDQLWQAPEGERATDENLYEVRFLKALLIEIKNKYKIDEKKIYMQGLSLGDQMTLHFARLYGDMLAGIACCAGPIAPECLFDKAGKPRECKVSMPVYQYRGEFDRLMFKAGPSCRTRYDLNRANLLFWQKRNGSTGIPEIFLEGEDNIAIYRDGEADIVYHDVYQYGHGQTLDSAEFIWNRFFSGLIRGQKHVEDCLESVNKKSTVAAVALNCPYMYANGQVSMINERSAVPDIMQKEIDLSRASKRFPGMDKPFEGLEFDPCVYVPLEFIVNTFLPEVEKREDGRVAMVLQDGRRIQIAAGSAACMIDGRMWRMESHVRFENGQILLQLKWFTYCIFNWHYQQKGNIICISEKYGTLTDDMALLLLEIMEEGRNRNDD